MYLIYNIYEMKNPKLAHKIESIKEESSIISLKEVNINHYMTNDWNIIYEANESIDFNKIFNIKKKDLEEKIKENFFIKLIGIEEKDEPVQIPKEFLEYKTYSSSFIDIFISKNLENKKSVIFHNEDKYFRFNLFQNLEMNYKNGIFGNFYINFELFRKSKGQERLERIAYFLSFFFPNDYQGFKTFFEDKIKYKISDELYCWNEIIVEIINYFQKNIFKQKKEDGKNEISQSNNKIKSLNDDIQLFNDVDKKKFIIIFDNILTDEENKVVENIIRESYNTNFIYFIIYPLINEFTSQQLIKFVHEPYDSFSPFSLIFANITNFESKGSIYEEKFDEKIFIENKVMDEIIFYDLIRIFNFKTIFVNSINCDINSKSLEFLIKYIKYLNIQFDNKTKKIINIAFKNKNVEEQFINIYENTFTSMKTKHNITFKNLIGQKDGFDLEKIIISKMIFKQKEKFEKLKVKSIFGLKEIKKEEGVNYEVSNFFIEQKSLNGVFDFAFKIIKDNKQYLKLTQITSLKDTEEKEKLSIEKMKINCSYLKKEFKDNKLGDLDGIYFCILAPLRILENENKKNYKDLKKFCKENNYEFILFDLNNSSFYERIKGKSYNKDIFEIDNNFQLNISNFNEIIQIDIPLNILSPIKVKERNENKEDLDINNVARNYISENIKRIAKFEYIGKFADLKRLDEKYFGYIYFKNEISIYFYKDKIIKINKDNENRDINTYSKKKLIFILYSAEIINENYLDSSEELEEDDIKKSPKKQTKGKKKTKSNIKKRRLDEEDDEESQESDKDKDNEDIKKNLKKQEINKKREIGMLNKRRKKIDEEKMDDKKFSKNKSTNYNEEKTFLNLKRKKNH